MNRTLLFNLLIAACTSSLIIATDIKKTTITIPFDIAQGDRMYHDYLDFTVDNPDIKIVAWHTDSEPVSSYDPTFKTNKKIYDHNITVMIDLEGPADAFNDAHLHINSYKKSNKKISQKLYALAPEPSTIDTIQQPLVQETPTHPMPNSPKHHQEESSPMSWSHYFSAHMQATESTFVRIIIAFLLGILLSLTPCIYPMIPITIGILQAQASSSLRRNFSLAFMYTMGIATTFSALGLVAAFSGKMFGSFMNSPLLIITIVLMLWYLAGSMLGLYNMYTPRFLLSNNTSTKGGSMTSAFLLGAASGTIASPCLSPGLILLLTIVSATGSVLLGFALLFAFGLGLGTPLLIIGTFSGSMNMLPRAGMWMIEVKQIFGLLMIATSFYFLTTIFSWHIIMWLIALFIFMSGLFFLYTANQPTSPLGKKIKKLIGTLLIAASMPTAFYAFKATMQKNECQDDTFCFSDFDQAQIAAKLEHKPLLIKISAPYCSICKAIDKKIFAHHDVKSALKNTAITIHVADIEANERLLSLKEKFNVIGAPTIILYDPATDTELKRWGSELYDQTPVTFIHEIEALTAAS